MLLRFLRYMFFGMLMGAWQIAVAQQPRLPLPDDTDYYLTHWTTAQGLPQSTVTKIITASDGYMWIGTYDGFARFDGVKIVPYNSANVKGMKSNIVQDMVERKGKLWILTTKELLCYDNDEVTAFPFPGDTDFSKSFRFVRDNELRISVGNYLYRFREGKFELIRMFPQIASQSSAVVSLDENHMLEFYMKGASGEYGCRGYKYGKFLSLLVGYTYLVGEVEKGKWLVAKWPLPANGKKSELPSWYVIDTSLEMKPLTFPIGIDSILDVEVTPNYERCYISRNRLYIVDEKNSIKAFLYKPDITISAIALSHEGNILIGTDNDGLYQAESKTVKIYRKSVDDPRHPEIRFVRQIDGMLYIGDWKGMNRFDTRKRMYVSDFPGIDGGDVEKDKDGTWYHATYGFGIAVRKKNTLSWLTPAVLPSGTVYNLSYDGDKLWIGTEAGLAVLKDGTITDLSRFDSSAIQHIAYGRDGSVWVASFNGVARYTTDMKPVLRLGLKEGLPNLTVRSLYIDKENTVWIGLLHGGLCCYKNGRITRFPQGSNSVNENVLSIIEDNYGYLWMSSNAGLYKVRKEELDAYTIDSLTELSVLHISEKQGLDAPEFNSHTQGKVAKTGDYLWYPGFKGLVCVHTVPQDSKSRQTVKIEGIYINSSRIPIKEDYVQLKNNQGTLRITYSIPEFTMPENLYFEYQLNNSGLWEPNGRERQLVFNDIEVGMNEIKIRVQGSSRFARVFVYVESRWYERTWAILVLILLGIFLLIFCTALVIRNINNRRLAREYQKRRMAVLELAALHNQINPHFIFNCVNSIQSIFFSKKFTVGNEYITQFSLFLRTCLEHSKKNIVTLNEEMEIIRYYLNLEKLQFNDDEFQFEIVTDPSVDQDVVTLPSFLLQPFAENSIKHGLLKSTNPEKRITISVGKNSQGGVYVYIDDNGPGMEATKTAKERPSRGLEMTNERVRNFNQIYSRNIRASYESLTGLNKTYPTGTRIIIELD